MEEETVTGIKIKRYETLCKNCKLPIIKNRRPTSFGFVCYDCRDKRRSAYYKKHVQTS